MKKILAVVGTNNKNSVNKKLVKYVSGLLEDVEIKLQDWTHFDAPIYSIDWEKERGIPVDVQILQNTLAEYEGVIIAVTEHNLTISTFLKNIIDWLSRADNQFLKNKKILLMSTSDDEKGSINALKYMREITPVFGAEVVESFSLPLFSKNFDEEKNTLNDEVMLLGLMEVLTNFQRNFQD